MKKGRFLFLGTGSSAGVPVIGCKCDVCSSSYLFNKRLRTAGLLDLEDKQILIDAGPDFRQQALQYNICRLDGLFLTHVHFDHIAGIDDLRIFCFQQESKIPCLLAKETLQEMKNRYHYLFVTHKKGIAQLDFKVLANDFGYDSFLGIKIGYLSYEQSGMKVSGFRIGNFAYVTDIKKFTPTVFSILDGVEILVVSALKKEGSLAHLSLDEAIAFGRNAGADKIFFTHISHEVDHDKVNDLLPKNVKLAHDGMELEFSYSNDS